MFRPLSETKFINDANLVSYWKLDETSGTTAVDSKGSNNGTWTNFAYGAGKYGNAGSFNGSSSFIQSSLVTNTTTNITISSWVYISGTSLSGVFVHNGDISASQDNGYCLGVGGTTFDNTGNNLIGLCNGVAWMNFGKAIGTGWHHVVMTRDATTWRGYVDGVASATTYTSNPITPTASTIIGRNTTASGSLHFFSGLIDDVSIFSRALSSAEVLELYEGINYGELVATPNTKLLLHLNGNSTDASGNGNNGSDTAITYVDGKFGQCASFNGSSSYISIPDNSVFDFGAGDFTISYWVKFNNFSSDPNTIAKGIYKTNGWYIQYNSTLCSFVVYDGGLKITAFNHGGVTGAWNLFTYVRSGTSGKRYKNGVEQTLTTNNSIGTIVANSTPVTLGIYSNLSQNRLNGSMDEVIIENRAWSSTEILNYYNQSKGVYAPKFNS